MVTTALILFLFAGLIVPHLIKNRTQFYAGFACILLIILMETLQVMIHRSGMQVFGGVVIGLSQLAALIAFFMCAGGLSLREVGDEFKGAFEVIRRGEEEKEVIIPLTGQKPIPRDTTPKDRIDLTPPVGQNAERREPPHPGIPME